MTVKQVMRVDRPAADPVGSLARPACSIERVRRLAVSMRRSRLAVVG
jgi:hypothetical protein